MGELRKYTEFQDILRDLDIADEDQLDLFDTLDVDGGGTIDLEELITGIAKLRGDARRSDIVGVGLIVRSVQLAMTDFQQTAMKLMHSQQRKLRQMESVLARSSAVRYQVLREDSEEYLSSVTSDNESVNKLS